MASECLRILHLTRALATPCSACGTRLRLRVRVQASPHSAHEVCRGVGCVEKSLPECVPAQRCSSSLLFSFAAARAAAARGGARMRARRGASSRYRAGVRSGDPVPIPDPISERSDRIGSAPGGLLAACGAGLSPHRTRPCAPARRAPDFSRPFGFRGLGRRSAPLAPLRSAPLAPLRSAPLRSPRPAGRA